MFWRSDPLSTWRPTESVQGQHQWICVCVLSRVRLFGLCGLQPIWLLCPWDNTGVGCHVLLQGIFLTQGSNPHFLHLLHWQEDSWPLCHLGKWIWCSSKSIFWALKGPESPSIAKASWSGHSPKEVKACSLTSPVPGDVICPVTTEKLPFQRA